MNKKITKNNKGITLIAFAIIILFVLAISFTVIYFIFYKAESPNVEEFSPEGVAISKEKKEKIAEIGMDIRIVSNITEEDIPIPKGFTYVSGNTKTGIIIQSTENEMKCLYIPYDENIKSEENEYYEKVEYIPMNSLDLNSILKYNGFFAILNTDFKMEDLKTINKSNYELQCEQSQYLFTDSESVNSHLLYKEEIAQINNYIATNKIDLGENTIGIYALTLEPFSEVNYNELTYETKDTKVDLSKLNSINNSNNKIVKTNNLNITKVDNNKSAKNEKSIWYFESSSSIYGANSKDKKKIPIPSGFKYCELKEGTVLIQDETNPNLIYIWVPCDYKNFTEVKNKVWNELYKKAGIDDKTKATYKMIEESKEEYEENFENSIKKYKGFYISQAELSKNSNGQYMNTMRGMKGYSVTGTVGGGDYIRGTNVGNDKIYSAMKSRIKKMYNEDKSVKSHLMYGVEYDATLLWIANTNSEFTSTTSDNKSQNIYATLCVDSTNVGKYINTGIEADADANEVTSFNAIWGLGGNLAEVTQEEYDKKYIIRGGSWNDTGANTPISSRNQTNDLKKDTIGFRTALYVDSDCTEAKSKNGSNTFKYSISDGVIETIDEIEFKVLEGNRYVNVWEEVNAYEKPNEASKVIKKYSMADKVAIDKKAVEPITKQDGTTIEWVRVVISNNQYAYLDAKKLTSEIVLGDTTDFVMSNGYAERYYTAGFKAYNEPEEKESEIAFECVYSGRIYCYR